MADITAKLLLVEALAQVRTSFTTSPIIQPGANKLVLCFVQITDFGFNNPILNIAVTGAALTWVEVGQVQMDTIVLKRQAYSVYRAMGPSPVSTSLVVTNDDIANLGQFIVVEFDNVDTGGANGSAAIVQIVTRVLDSDTTISATLAPFGGSNNAAVGGFGGGAAGAPTWTPGAGFTEIAESTGFDRVTMVQFKASPTILVDASCDTVGAMAVLGIELKNADPGPAVVFPVGAPSIISGNLIT